MTNQWKMLQNLYEYLNYISSYCVHTINNSWFVNDIIRRYKGLSLAEKTNQSLCIHYVYQNKEYKVYIPYEKKYMNRMMNSDVFVQYENSNIKINQQPGVPYLITPKHLGAKNAIIHSLEGNTTIEPNQKIDI
jgi:hypothetical protein